MSKGDKDKGNAARRRRYADRGRGIRRWDTWRVCDAVDMDLAEPDVDDEPPPQRRPDAPR